MSHVVLDLLPSHLHWQHYVAEGIICDEIALSLLENWLKFFVFFLRLFPILTLFVTNRFQKTKLVLNLKLYIFNCFLFHQKNIFLSFSLWRRQS
jgi:hypothetical protein